MLTELTMMTAVLLVDIRPDPVGLRIGTLELILLAIVALVFSAILIVGFVLIFKRMRRGEANNAFSPNPVTNRTADAFHQRSNPNQL
jgi:hypothetical protein